MSPSRIRAIPFKSIPGALEKVGPERSSVRVRNFFHSHKYSNAIMRKVWGLDLALWNLGLRVRYKTLSRLRRGLYLRLYWARVTILTSVSPKKGFQLETKGPCPSHKIPKKVDTGQMHRTRSLSPCTRFA